ncbi:MAG: GNAT family N-acetyltransferase [Bdellovibrionales bacterium]
MKNDVSIRCLNDDSDARIIAGWFHDFWGQIPPFLSLEQEYECLKKSFRKKNADLPFSLVYYLDKEPVGIICVSKEEMHTGRSDLSPWVNSTFVIERIRHKGIASALLGELHKILKDLGYKQAYVATREVARLYQRNGYEYLSSEQYDGVKFDVLKRNL